MTHALKTWPQYFKEVISGTKNFELRKDDRDYKVGDKLLLQEYDKDKYTGEEYTCVISYILRDAEMFGLKPGYCILGLVEIFM